MAVFNTKKKWRLTNNRIHTPKSAYKHQTHKIKYQYAEDMAQELIIPNDSERVFCLISGRFIFGDFIEALCVKHDWDVVDMTISTLSMSQDNVDSLKNLLAGGYVRSLNLIVSDYFYAHERSKSGLMPYIYEKLDIDDKFQIAAASVHTKIVLIKTACGKHLTIHGSPNLRTSDNIEQFMIENCRDLYQFNKQWHDSVLDSYSTINKSVRGEKAWQAVATENQKANQKANLERKQQHQKERLKEAKF